MPIQSPDGSRPSSRPIRCFISPAALLVKVTAKIRPGGTPCWSISSAMRMVSTRVLPEPAPASTSSGPRDVLHRLALGRVERGLQALLRRLDHEGRRRELAAA